MKGPAVGYACSTVLAVLGCLAVVLGAPWSLVILAQSLVLALFFGFGGLRIHLKHRKPAQAVSAPDPGQLANAAQTARRHALEYGLPTDPWTQLEGFWTASGDLVTVIDDVRLADEPRDSFMDEFAKAMSSPLASEDPAVILTAGRKPSGEPFDLDSFVERTREREVRAVQTRASHLRHAASFRQLTADERSEAYDLAKQWKTLDAQPQDTDPTVRHTWTLTGTPEDDHVIRALRDAGVNVAIETTDTKQAHLAGRQSAINAAKHAYTNGWRQRRARTRIGPPPGTTQPTPNTPDRSLAASKRRNPTSTSDDATQQHLQTTQLFF